MSQPLEALKLANAIRSEMKLEKEAIRAGLVNPVELIRTTSNPYTVRGLLVSIRGVGEIRAAAIARKARVRDHAVIRDLHDIHRMRLAVTVGQMLEARANRQKSRADWREAA